MEQNLVYDNNGITIINSDIINADIPNESVDLIVTSPPYNLKKNYDNYKDDLSYNDYLVFSKEWLTKSFNLTKTNGRLCLDIPFTTIEDDEKHSIASDLTQIAKMVGWKYRASIIWVKYGVQSRTAWGSFGSAKALNIMTPAELIVVFYKDNWDKQVTGKTNITNDEFSHWVMGIWNFPIVHDEIHPAPYPEELSTRCIKLFSYVGDTILDPFMGSGTTLISAFKNKRKAIGVDISRVYCDYAVNRLKMTGINAEANFKRYFK
jgi:site-specific DNA-methyltransferase (adenine-specific)